MTSIMEVSTHWPRQVRLDDRVQELGLTPVELRRYKAGFGLESLCWDPEESEADALHSAADKLVGLKGREHCVKYVIRARTVRYASPYPLNPLQVVVDRLGLDRAQSFTVTDQACASGLLALDLAGLLLSADPDPDALALVLAGEKAIAPVSQIIPRVSITGEATAAVLVGREAGDRVLGYAVITHPIPDSALVMSAEGHRAFGDAYPVLLREVIDGALAAAGLKRTDVDAILPHNVNVLVWKRLAPALGFSAAQVFLDNVSRTGHCFAADPFINHVSATSVGWLPPGARYLMTSVGLGATFAATVVQR